MPDANDMDLVREYARQNSEAAFAELVRRHINLVYSVALRFTGNSNDAEDVTQAAFIMLARKAAGLRERTVVAGWLYETTRLTAAGLLRTQNRRRARELEACMQSHLNAPGTDDVWRQLAPHLEAAMARLAERDRTLLALRFHENKTGAEAAAQLGIREEAAHKRTARALEKLRRFFAKRGVDSTTAIIAGAISANSVQAAPPALASSVTALAFAKGATAPISTLTLIKGALKIMAWTKMKTVVVVGLAAILTAGTTTELAIRHQRHANHQALLDAAGSGEFSSQRLQGHWTGSNTAHPGQACTLKISGDQIEYRGAEPNDWLRGTFVLSESAKPKQMNVTILEPARESSKMILIIYQLKGDEITLAAAPHGSSRRPVNFSPGPEVDVLELQHD